MVAGIFDSLWMTALAGTLAGAALTGLALTWWRRRRAAARPEALIHIQPVGAAQSARAADRTAKPFIPPPAPVAGAPGDPAAEKRAQFRRVGNAVMIQVADADEQRHPFQAWVIDRSRHGLRIASERKLTVGDMVTVRPVLATPSTPWCAVEVRHCIAIDGHWEVGCRFLAPPPIQVMVLFG